MKRKGIMKWLTAFVMLALVVCLLPVTADAITVNGEDYGITFSAGTLYCRTCGAAAMSCTDLEISQFSLSGNKLSVTYTFTLHYTHTYTVTEVYEYFSCMTSYSEQNVGVSGPLKFSREAGHFSNNWTSNGDGTHTGICAICGKEVTESCSGDSNANCSTEGTCSKCGGKYTPADDHAYKWESDGSKHMQVCENNPAHVKDKAYCSVGSTGTAATCTDAAVCGTCGNPFGDRDENAHAWGDWTYGAGDENHTRTCALDPSHTETGKHDFTYALKPGDASHLYGTCGTCNYTMEAWVEYNNYPKNYSGSPIEALSIRYSDNWVGEKVADSAIVYKDNVKAGEATGTVTIAGVQLTAKFEIVPTTLTVTAISAQSRAYDGTDKITVTKVTFTGKLGDDDVDIKLATASVGTADAGTYTTAEISMADLELTGTDKNNYVLLPANLVSTDAPVVISPKEITVTITAPDSVYDAVVAPTIVFNGLLEQDKSSAVITYTGTTEKIVDDEKVKYESNTAPEVAGTYTVTVAVNNTNYKLTGTTTADFKIEKAKTDYDAPTANKLTYNGEKQPLLSPGTVSGNSNPIRYKLADDKDWSTTIPAMKDAGTYEVLWSIEEDENYLGAEGKVTVTVGKAELTVTPDKLSMVYGSVRPALTYAVTGTVGTEVPVFTGYLSMYGEDAGTYEIGIGSLKLKDNGSFKAANYRIKLEKVKFVINPAYLLITAEDQTITYGAAIDGKNFTITDTKGDDVATVTLTPSTTEVTYNGTITPSAVIKNEDGEDVSRNYYIACLPGKLVIQPDFAAIEGVTTETVKPASREEIEALQDSLENADTTGATDEQKQKIEEAKASCEALLAQLDKVDAATDTDAIKKTEGITEETVELTDKDALEQAIDDLKQAKEDYAGNYSAEDLKAMDEKIGQLEGALKTINNANAVIDMLNALPTDVQAEDEAAAGARAAYAALTDREKELVRSSEAGAILDGIAYKILSGDGSTWERGKKLTFVIDGDISRFTGIKVDGIPVSEKYYEVEAGSTVVTLKRGYQKKLDAEGEHTIKFQFADGEVDGIFFLEEASGFSLWALLIGLILALAAAAGGAVLYFRKKKSA